MIAGPDIFMKLGVEDEDFLEIWLSSSEAPDEGSQEVFLTRLGHCRDQVAEELLKTSSGDVRAQLTCLFNALMAVDKFISSSP